MQSKKETSAPYGAGVFASRSQEEPPKGQPPLKAILHAKALPCQVLYGKETQPHRIFFIWIFGLNLPVKFVQFANRTLFILFL